MDREAESESDVAQSDDESEPEEAAVPQDAARGVAASRHDARVDIATNGDAYLVVQERLRAQLSLPADENVPSRRLSGDSAARSAFLTLLPLAEQRRLFLWTLASFPQATMRVRAIFGTPPYPWLFANDGAALQAAAFAPSRRNMSGQDALSVLGTVSSYVTFGQAHFRDSSERQYRVTPLALTRSADRFFVARAFESTAELHFTCRVPKRARRAKPGTPPAKRSAGLPRVGELLQLRMARALRGVSALGAFETLRVRVSRVQQRRAGAATALVQTARV
jgi:hypothetical protein